MLWDHIDTDSLEYFASLSAASYIILNDDLVKETLRSRAYIDLQRLAQSKNNKQSGILVPYHEDRLFEYTQIPGRLVPGLKTLESASGYPWAGQIDELLASGISLYQATRGLQTGPKIYKEIARGNSFIVDTDRKKSFPNAVVDRYPELDWVAMWCGYPADFRAACGFDADDPRQYKLVKDFCNSAAGSGREFEQAWLISADLSTLPEAMAQYRGQLQTAALQDVVNRPEIATAFAACGFDETEVRNKTHYVCNSEIERKESEGGLLKRRTMVTTIAYESDGHPCKVKSMDDATAVLRLMNSGIEERKHFVQKKYRDRETLLRALIEKYPEIPVELFSTIDPLWRKKAAMMLDFGKRMNNGENPIMLSKLLVPCRRCNGGGCVE